MKKGFLILVLLSVLLVSCNLKQETVKLAITQTAVITDQADLAYRQSAFSTEMAQKATDYSMFMEKTQVAFNSMLASTQESFDFRATGLANTQMVLDSTATFQESIISTQQAINEAEIARLRILEEAAKARSNPEVDWIDPILDDLLLTTDISIGNDSFVFKGIRYSEKAITGVNLASRFIYYDFSTAEDSYVRIMATRDPSLIPYDYQQIVTNNERGNWKRIVVNQQPYFYKSKNYGNEISTIVNLNDDCFVLVTVLSAYSEAVNSWIDYLADTIFIIQSTNQPLCEGT